MLHYTEEYLCDLCEASTSHLDLEKLASKKVLVTGASGLICSALVDQLLIWSISLIWSYTLLGAAKKK